MATTASLTTSPTTIDSGVSDNVSITNTGTVDVTIVRGSQSFTLRPTQARVVYPEGAAVTAATASGAGSVSYAATAARTSAAQQYAADAAFTNTYARRDANTIVWLGDSITGNGDGPGSPGTGLANVSYHPRGFWVWGQSFLGHRLRTLTNAGVGGDTSAQVLARVPSVTALAPGWCHVLAGSNDVAQGIVMSTIQANLTAIWDQLNAAGIRVIAGTIPPHSTYTGSMSADTDTLNTWIRDQGRRRKNLIVVDYHSVLCTASGLVYTADATFDGTHPSSIGAARMGRILADTIGPLIPYQPQLCSGEGDSTNLAANGRFTAGGSAALPTGWSSNLTGAAFSKTARTDKVQGSWQTVTVANAATGYLQKNVTVDGTKLAVGDSVVATVEYSISGLDQAASATTQGFWLMIQSYDGATATTIMIDMYFIRLSTENMPAWDRSGVLRTPPVAVPAGTTQILTLIEMSGGGTYNLDRFALFNATKLGLLT